MAYQEVTNQGIDIKEYLGKPMEGFYLETTTHDGKFGDYKVHTFQSLKGPIVNIFGFTMFNLKMERITPGTLCKITYTGTENVKTKYGMKDVHQIKVEQDPSRKMATDTLPAPTAQQATATNVPVTPVPTSTYQEEDGADDLPF
jgi:hypothetical protein